MRHDRLLTAACLVIISAAPAAAQCRAGFYEYRQERVGNTVTHYCVRVTHQARLGAVEAELAALEPRIARERAAIEQWQKTLPDYLGSLDEWVNADQRAREETRERAREAMTTTFLSLLRVQALQNQRNARQKLDAVWAAFRDSPLASPEFQRLFAEQRVGVLALRKWETREQPLETLEKLATGVAGMHGANSGDYARALLQIMKLTLTDPRAAILADELDFTASAITGNAVAWTARTRVDQLWRLGGQRLQALSSDTKISTSDIDKRNALRKERQEIFADQ